MARGRSLVPATWRVLDAALQRWTVTDLADVFFPTFPGAAAFSRQFVLCHLLERCLRHGGELSLLLGLAGLAL